jgi:hypothetical protein
MEKVIKKKEGEFKNTKRGVQKHDNFVLIHLGSSQKNVAFFSPFFFPPRLFSRLFYSRFWAFRNKGSGNAIKNSHGRRSAAAKKSTYLLERHIFFLRPPLKLVA